MIDAFLWIYHFIWNSKIVKLDHALRSVVLPNSIMTTYLSYSWLPEFSVFLATRNHHKCTIGIGVIRALRLGKKLIL